MNILKNINWKVRFRNPVFWATVVPALITFVYVVLKALGIVPVLEENVLLEIVSAVIAALTTIGVLVDPTTGGIGDSALALTYEAPRKDDTEEEAEIV